MTKNQTKLLKDLSNIPWEFNKPLADLTYFKLGGPAEIFLKTDDDNVLVQVITFCNKTKIPVTYFGGASNVIVDDEGIKGVVIHYNNSEWQVLESGEENKVCIAGAGLKTSLLVRKSLDAGLSGLECFLGVPGTLGGAVVNNAHYQNQLIGNFISQVQVISTLGEIIWIHHDDCNFSYDQSRFKSSHELVLRVQLLLKPGTLIKSMELVAESTQLRANTQPLGQPSSGCIFQNIPNTPELRQLFPQFSNKSEFPVSFLIDQAGLKGTKIGGIEVSKKHAAFFINTGKGTSKDVLALIKQVKSEVAKKFGVNLQEEVFYLS